MVAAIGLAHSLLSCHEPRHRHSAVPYLLPGAPLRYGQNAKSKARALALEISIHAKLFGCNPSQFIGCLKYLIRRNIRIRQPVELHQEGLIGLFWDRLHF
jgi:hypothetical protein